MSLLQSRLSILQFTKLMSNVYSKKLFLPASISLDIYYMLIHIWMQYHSYLQRKSSFTHELHFSSDLLLARTSISFQFLWQKIMKKEHKIQCGACKLNNNYQPITVTRQNPGYRINLTILLLRLKSSFLTQKSCNQE